MKTAGNDSLDDDDNDARPTDCMSYMTSRRNSSMAQTATTAVYVGE